MSKEHYETALRILQEHEDWLLLEFEQKMTHWKGRSGFFDGKDARDWLHKYKQVKRELADTIEFLKELSPKQDTKELS